MHALTYNPSYWSNVRIRRMLLMRGYCLPSRLMPQLFAPPRFTVPGVPEQGAESQIPKRVFVFSEKLK